MSEPAGRTLALIRERGLRIWAACKPCAHGWWLAPKRGEPSEHDHLTVGEALDAELFRCPKCQGPAQALMVYDKAGSPNQRERWALGEKPDVRWP